MPHCQIASCRNNSARAHSDEGISFFHFPKDPNIRSQWIHFCDRGESKWTPRADDRVCSVHFQLDDFQRDLQAELMGTPARKKLKNSAVPSLCLSREHVSSVFTPTPCRRAAISKLTHAREIEEMLSTATTAATSSAAATSVPSPCPASSDSDDSANDTEGGHDTTFYPSSAHSSEEGGDIVMDTSLQNKVFLIYFSELLLLLKTGLPHCGQNFRRRRSSEKYIKKTLF